MYFTPGWSSEDGGSLDLFSVDMNGCPADVKCRLVPSFNSVRKSDAAFIHTHVLNPLILILLQYFHLNLIYSNILAILTIRISPHI